MKVICLTFLVLCILIIPPVSKGYSLRVQRIIPSTTNLITMLRPGLDPELAEVHAKYIDKHVQLWCVDRDVFVSIVNAESSFNSMAENESGALGACQIMERAHKDKFKKRRIMFRKEIFYLDNNYSLGCEIYYEAVQNSDTLEGALTRYVGGSNPEYVEQVKKDAKKCKAMIKNELIIDEELGGFIY